MGHRWAGIGLPRSQSFASLSLPPHLLVLLRSLSWTICDPAVLIFLPLCSLCCLCRSISLLVSQQYCPSPPNMLSGARGCQHSVAAACSLAAPAGLIGQGGPDLEGALSCPRSLGPDQGWQSLTVGKGLLSWAAGGLEPPFVAVAHPSLFQIAVRSSCAT